MTQALRQLAEDFLSAILFFAVYAATDNLYAAVAIAVIGGVAQVAKKKLGRQRVEPMQWMSLGLVVVLGGATILAQSPRLMMLKPSIVHLAVAGIMLLQRGWMGRYLPPIAREHLPAGVVVAAGYGWAALLVALAAANLVVATNFDIATWAWFVGVGLLGAKLAAFAAQYVVFRAIIRRSLRRPAGIAAEGDLILRSALLASVVAALLLCIGGGTAGAVGFQEVAVPDPGAQPLQLMIWYPSTASPTSRPLGLYDQTVAVDGPVAGQLLPLVVISHGTGGGAQTHYDTALALAEAGFVAVALTHTGDNWRDHSVSFTQRNFVDRPRHLKLAIDYLLTSWSGRDHLAPGRVGAFGHSAGGFTVLVAIGGEPDLSRLSAFCSEHSEDWGCQHARQRSTAVSTAAAAVPTWVHDPQIKAAVIAATAAGHSFTPTGLSGVKVPVQLWQAERDRITVNRWSGEVIRAGLPAPPDNHVVPLAGHFSFLAPCSEAFAARVPAEICEEAPGFDRAAFHHEFNAAVAAFFAKALTE